MAIIVSQEISVSDIKCSYCGMKKKMLWVLRVAYLPVELAQNNVQWPWCLVPHHYWEVEVAGAVPVPDLSNQGPGSDEGFLFALWQIKSPDYCWNIRDFSLKYCALKAKSMSKPNKDKNSCWFHLCLIILLLAFQGFFCCSHRDQC